MCVCDGDVCYCICFIIYIMTLVIGGVFLLWRGVVCLAFTYNAVAIPLRASFDIYQIRGLVAWFVLDYLFDIVYLLDIILVQFHLSYRMNGVLEVSGSCDHCLNVMVILRLSAMVKSCV